MRKSIWILAAVTSALTALVIGCSGKKSNSGSTSYSYNGPGSHWTMVRTGSSYTLTMTDGADGLTINATSETLATGHIKLTVTSATATGAASAPAVGTVAHAVEVPGTAFLLLPMEAGAETIAMITAGSCPATNFTANWVIGERAAAAGTKVTDDAGDWYGSIVWDTAGGTATFPLYRSVEDPLTSWGDNAGPQAIGTCSAGRVSDTGGGVEAYFTTSGLAIIATNVGTGDESHIIGVPQAAVTAASSIYGNYKGFIFDQENTTSLAATATFAAGTGVVGDITLQVKTGADLTANGASYVARMAAVDSPGTGLMRGQFSACANGSVTDFDGTCEIVCAASKNVNSSGKTFLYCIGQHPSDEDDRMTILLVSE